MRTTPCFSSAFNVLDTAPNSAASSATRSSPACSASTMDACLTAFLRGSNPSKAAPGSTQRSSTSPTAGSSSRQYPACARTMRGTPPGGVNRRTHDDSGAR